MSPALIAIDWGSSSFRGYLMSRGGEVLEETASGDGIGSVGAGEYPATLRRLVGRWLDSNPALPVIASGMVGSRHGWREAPYLACPAGPRDVAERLTAVEANGRRVVLAPGLSYADDAGADVMRGEETEIFGIADAGARLIVLPGSHSKWAGRRRAHCRVQDLHHRRAVRRAARPHGRRRLRPGRAGKRTRTGVRARRRARRRGGPLRDEVRPHRPPVRRPRAAAHGQARSRRCRRISFGPPDRSRDRRGEAALSG
jgi:2-keto-3-deoxy-galactonokinase